MAARGHFMEQQLTNISSVILNKSEKYQLNITNDIVQKMATSAAQQQQIIPQIINQIVHFLQQIFNIQQQL